MWSQNAFTERLKLKWPILQAPMGWLSTPALAAGVSNAGGLGGRVEPADGGMNLVLGAMQAADATEQIGKALEIAGFFQLRAAHNGRKAHHLRVGLAMP